MVGKRRVIKPILGVVMYTGVAITVPAEEVIDISEAPPEEDRTVDVMWRGQALMMFVADVKARSLSLGED